MITVCRNGLPISVSQITNNGRLIYEMPFQNNFHSSHALRGRAGFTWPNSKVRMTTLRFDSHCTSSSDSCVLLTHPCLSMRFSGRDEAFIARGNAMAGHNTCPLPQIYCDCSLFIAQAEFGLQCDRINISDADDLVFQDCRQKTFFVLHVRGGPESAI